MPKKEARLVMPTQDQLKTWSTSQLIVAMNQLIALDLELISTKDLTDFKGATGEQLDGLMTRVATELDERIPARNAN